MEKGYYVWLYNSLVSHDILTYSSRLKVIFDTMLKSFAFDLHRSHHQGVAKEMSWVANAFTGTKTET